MICKECQRDKRKYSSGLCSTCYRNKYNRAGTCVECGGKTCRPTYLRCVACSNQLYLRNLGRVHSQETRQKIRENTPIKTGQQHPRWTGGQSRFWKDRAKKRDNFTCQKCGMSDHDIMVVDHIIPKSVRPDLDCDIDNLMTLCPNCHARKTIYEKRNKVYKVGYQLP